MEVTILRSKVGSSIVGLEIRTERSLHSKALKALGELSVAAGVAVALVDETAAGGIEETSGR